MGFWSRVFSESGEPSSKRIAGFIIIAVVLGSTVLLVWKDGGSPVVQSLLQTEIIMGGSLIGLSTITDAFQPREKEENKPNNTPSPKHVDEEEDISL